MEGKPLYQDAKIRADPLPIREIRVPTYICPVKTLRLVFRLLFFVFYTAAIVLEIWLRGLLFGHNTRRAMRIRRRWARNLLPTVGIRVETHGDIPDYPCLIVGNHRSYLDPIVLLRDVDAYPVAKAELADWPIIGKGARMAGILYLQRESAASRGEILRLMGRRIEAGFQVIIFPEGTTSGLPGTLPFRKGGFQLAARSGIPVVPVALCFADPADYWVGHESFGGHAARRFGEKRIDLTLFYGPPMQHEDAEVLMAEARAWIEERLKGG
jgi:1-acyl-sn-glycerol-3-phosphate acyltransferase